MAELNQLTVATHRLISTNPDIVDNVFQADPLPALGRETLNKDFPGGRLIQESFIYNGLIGGPYLPGKEFDISEPQIEQGLQFTMKFDEVNVTMSKEDVQVLNTGPMAAFRLIKVRMEAAYTTVGAHIAIGAYLNGVNANYTPNVNGFAEALNDGSTAGWDGNTYATYGTITRGGAVGTTINSVPVNVAGPITYLQMETDYSAASFGNGKYEPNTVLTTFLTYSYIKNVFQTQQRFNDTQDPKLGFNGLKFNNAIVMRSRYCPGTYISGSGDPIAVTFFKQMSSGALLVYPTVTAETMWYLNARNPFMNYYVSKDAEYGMGFTGFKPAQGNTKVAGQVLNAGQWTFHPRYHKYEFGITS